ncbi:TolC family protein [Bacteroides sp. 51]|uniref:TolC family protein n=1 Tax=Bacteroides sp. 51 TaxID=2302938 RepID=UPI0013D23A49|nr:TolC family protein [Bacteroides sp. 51]NDV84818.1 TolC family protein [Bacteroides sp. 51]
MKRIIFTMLSTLVLQWGVAQQITLEECRQKAQANYPLIVQYDLVEKTKEYNLGNASKGYLPQFSLTGKATYQSDVTELPVEIPGVSIKGLSKDQYQVMLELNQKIWDGGEIHYKRKQVKATSDVDREQLNVDMYALNDRVNQVYFGILMLDESLKQNKFLQEDLQRSYQQVSAYMANGVANQSDLDAVRVEQLNTRQSETELLTSRGAYLQMLSLLIGEEINRETKFLKPVTTEVTLANEINRPELLWFDAQRESLDASESSLRVRNRPNLGLFVQGAYGNPGLNMLKNEFSPFYVAGVRLSWNFGALYTLRNDKRVIENNRRKLQSNREVFLFNTRLQATQDNSAIQSVKALMREDDEIIALRTNIRKAAEAKVANGTLTVTDMLREITAESLARQIKAMHEVQLLMNIYQWKYTTNN